MKLTHVEMMYDETDAYCISGASGSNAYIACQGPLPHTVNDFWRMVVECEVQVIVMACNEQVSFLIIFSFVKKLNFYLFKEIK